MVHYRRNFAAGGTFFLTAVLADRTSNTLIDHVAALRSAVIHIRRQHPFKIEAVIVLPDHLHVVLTLPDGDADFSTRVSLIKRRFTNAVQKAGVAVTRRRNGELALWQHRFWEHTIRDDLDFERHVNYIHFNPVKHELVMRVRDWPYSSFHRFVRLGILSEDWGGDLRQDFGSFGERHG